MTTSPNIPAGWENILDADETILWQGRPNALIVLKPRKILVFVFGIFFAGFALFWMVMAAQGGGGMWMFGLIHFSVGISLSFGALFWDAWRRRYTWYTLTNRRAFIATNIPLRGRNLTSYPITADIVLDFIKGRFSTIIFARKTVQVKNGSKQMNIGFERIKDADRVFRLIREIQTGEDKQT